MSQSTPNFNCTSVESFTTLTKLINLKDQLTIHFMNVQRICNRDKFQTLKDYLGALSPEPDIFACAETWITENETSENSKTPCIFKIPTYSVEFCSRPTRSAGLALYIKENINYEVIAKSNGDISFVHIKLSDESEKELYLTICYMPQLANHSKLFDVLEGLFTAVGGQKHLLLGDFNIDLMRQEPVQRNYKNLLESYGYAISNTNATRVTENSSTLIDHSISNFGQAFNFTINTRRGLIPCRPFESPLPPISDHRALVTYVALFSQRNDKKVVTKTIVNYQKIKDVLMLDLSRSKYEHMCPDELAHYITETVSQATISNTTTKKFTMRKSVKVHVDVEVVRMSNAKKKILRKLRHQPQNSRLKQKIDRLTIQIDERKKRLRCEFIKSKFNASTSTKSKWQELNRLLGRNKSQTVINRLFNKNKTRVLVQPCDIVNELNSYFSTVGQELAEAIITTSSPTIITPCNVNSLFLFPPSEQEVLRLINDLDTTKSPGIDGITNKVVKECKQALAQPLTCLASKCFSEGTFPDCFKIARVSPIFKTGDKAVASNYRPISVLSVFNQILEKLINKRIRQFLLKTGYLHPRQFGFRQKSSTTTATIELTNFIYGQLNKKDTGVVSGLTIDLSKAFDSVSHSKLLQKCNKAGLRGPVHDLLTSYLSARQQIVCLQGERSDTKPVAFGVPQGSILGPTLFILYINDLAQLRLEGECFLFADDAAFFYPGRDDTQTCAAINRDIIELVKYFNWNLLTVNARKTNVIHFRTSKMRFIGDVDVVMSDTIVRKVDSISYLGLKMDEHLNWRDQCISVAKKVSRIAGIIWQLKPVLPMEERWSIYHAFAGSALTGLVEIWGLAANCHMKLVQTAQNRAIKNILNLNVLTPTRELYTIHATNILPVKGLHVQKICKYVKQLINNETHSNIQLPPRLYSRPLRHHETLHTGNARNSFGERRFEYYGPHTYNKLPPTIQDTTETHKFTKLVKVHLQTDDLWISEIIL